VTSEPDLADLHFDTTRPHPARVYDYLLGGKDNYPADREAAAKIIAVAPEIVDGARANRAFLGRAVCYLAAEKGVRQFLDIGTGIPAAGSTHEVAQGVAPAARVVYADHDPVVLAHARALLVSHPSGATSYIQSDLRDRGKIIRDARKLLDFTKPVALLLVAVLHFIPDTDDPQAIIAFYRDSLPRGSYLVLSHGTTDFHPADVAATAMSAYQNGPAPLVLRPKAAIEAFFDGFTLKPPGLVQAPLWHPGKGDEPDPEQLKKIAVYAGVAKKD
jgi:hypothetical protein